MSPYWDPSDPTIVHAFQREINRLGASFNFENPFALDFSALLPRELTTVKLRNRFVMINNHVYAANPKVVRPMLSISKYMLVIHLKPIHIRFSSCLTLDTPIPPCSLQGHCWSTIRQEPNDPIFITDGKRPIFAIQNLDVMVSQANRTIMMTVNNKILL